MKLYRKIQLTQGQFALVDAEDFERVNKFKWYARYSSHTKTFRAMRSLNPGTIHLSRFILNLNKFWKDGVVDHINHKTLDNRKQNLQIISIGENCIRRRKLSGLHEYKGIMETRPGVYQVRVSKNYRHYNVGTFRDKKEAALAYNKKAVELFGKHAVLNKV